MALVTSCSTPSTTQSEIGNQKSKMLSGPAPAQPATTAQEAFVIPHHKLGLDLRYGVHRHAHQNQQRRPAKIKLISHTCGNPLEPRRRADKGIEERSDQRQPR